MNVPQLYERYYGGAKARRGFFDAIASVQSPERVLYAGSFIHVTASFVFPKVTYVDVDRQSKRFFKEHADVLRFVEKRASYPQASELDFVGCSYEEPLPLDDASFDLLVSLYAGFISKPCKRYLRVGGVLAVNNSHGDAGLASIDPDYALIGVIKGRGDMLRVSEDDLDAYLVPKKPVELSEDYFRRRGRGIAYTRPAAGYLFRRLR